MTAQVLQQISLLQVSGITQTVSLKLIYRSVMGDKIMMPMMMTTLIFTVELFDRISVVITKFKQIGLYKPKWTDIY